MAACPDPALRAFVDRRMNGIARDLDPLDDLVGSSNSNVRAWMERKAKLADGARPGLPMVAPETLTALVRAERRLTPYARIDVGSRTERSLWDVVFVALLRDVASAYKAISHRTRSTPASSRRRHLEHRSTLTADRAYADAVTRPAALERDHGLGAAEASDLWLLAPQRTASCTKDT